MSEVTQSGLVAASSLWRRSDCMSANWCVPHTYKPEEPELRLSALPAALELLIERTHTAAEGTSEMLLWTGDTERPQSGAECTSYALLICIHWKYMNWAKCNCTSHKQLVSNPLLPLHLDGSKGCEKPPMFSMLWEDWFEPTDARRWSCDSVP
jgi:hypothetical protein